MSDTSGSHPFAELARQSPEAVGIVAKYLENSAQERERIEDAARTRLEDELQEWKLRALRAEAQLQTARNQMDALFFPSIPSDEELLSTEEIRNRAGFSVFG